MGSAQTVVWSPELPVVPPLVVDAVQETSQLFDATIEQPLVVGGGGGGGAEALHLSRQAL